MAAKTCPKCPNSPIMTATKIVAIIPFMVNERFVNIKPVSETAGYPVQLYVCPQCRLIELYQEI